MGKFKGKVVIITGASSGIGAATAVAFANEGAKLVLAGRNKERLRDSAKACKSGTEVLEHVSDLSEFKNIERLVTATVEKFGAIDILVNNAGFGDICLVEKIELDKYEALFNTNLRCPVFLCKFALPHLKKTKGCVVNISSAAGLRCIESCVPYSMTKAALDHFTRGFAAECAAFGVRVNSINPGGVKTRFSENAGMKFNAAQIAEFITKRMPLGMLYPETIAESILFISASPQITGICLPIDSGSLVSGTGIK